MKMVRKNRAERQAEAAQRAIDAGPPLAQIDDPDDDGYQEAYLQVDRLLRKSSHLYDWKQVGADDAHGDWSEFLVGMGATRLDLAQPRFLSRSIRLWKDAGEPEHTDAFRAGLLHRP
jgi:hypothetical protein